jgi:four helix bundle protein
MVIKSFEDLEVWNKAKDLVLKIYTMTANFPKEETYGITSQMKRAALSVPANIAEGFGRYHYLDKAKFYLNSRGSLFELKNFVLISIDLKFIDVDNANELIYEIDQLGVKLNNLVNATRDRATK